MSPAARVLLGEHGLAPGDVRATGPRGVLTKGAFPAPLLPSVHRPSETPWLAASDLSGFEMVVLRFLQTAVIKS